MHCYVYHSSRRPGTYVYLPRRDDFAGVPQALLDALGRLEFALAFDLPPERRLAQEDTATVLANLESKGFHLQLPPPEE
ncbi:YcgL domain-containing protein [Thioalkalivibrio paradoxus]|uniref:YcgL domain-containing protein THITH_15730 n=1 Tax=Thioalkalivibrio paradoxus ARh 1 TaxID=713585 RepID=W0DRK2_9GAMM|nr:YcgL domain-containing protein [Thioalkalivibrio paradoxus]AHE99490.1 membrane protein [Thioalkalivibrio paradoxus ARh 1]